MIIYLKQCPDTRVIISWKEYVLYAEGTDQIEHQKTVLKRTSHNYNKLSKSTHRARRCLQSPKFIILPWSPTLSTAHSCITSELLESQLLPVIFSLSVHQYPVLSFCNLHAIGLWMPKRLIPSLILHNEQN